MKSKYKFQTYTQTARAIEKDVHILIPAKQTSKRRQVLHQTEIQNILAFQLSSNKPRITFLPECSICKLWSKFFFSAKCQQIVESVILFYYIIKESVVFKSCPCWLTHILLLSVWNFLCCFHSHSQKPALLCPPLGLKLTPLHLKIDGMQTGNRFQNSRSKQIKRQPCRLHLKYLLQIKILTTRRGRCPRTG